MDRLNVPAEAGELGLGCDELTLSENVLRWKSARSSGALDPRDCRLGVWVCLTPRVARKLRFDSRTLPAFRGYRAQEEWTLFSRAPIHLETIGNLRRGASDLCAWGQLEGSFPREAPVFRLNLLHQGPRLESVGDGKSVESLNAVSELCLETLKWEAFSVRSMRSRRVFEWAEPPGFSAHREAGAFYVPHCDGPLAGVVEQIESFFRERVA
jgi:hypothetical protein